MYYEFLYFFCLQTFVTKNKELCFVFKNIYIRISTYIYKNHNQCLDLALYDNGYDYSLIKKFNPWHLGMLR